MIWSIILIIIAINLLVVIFGCKRHQFKQVKADPELDSFFNPKKDMGEMRCSCGGSVKRYQEERFAGTIYYTECEQCGRKAYSVYSQEYTDNLFNTPLVAKPYSDSEELNEP